MIGEAQRQKAEAFLAMHRSGPILRLANAWDAASAKVFETVGFRAIGTTSAGIANSLGHPDGQRMSIDENAAVVRRIAANVAVPVSADIEAGYASDPEGAARAAAIVIEAGGVGINLEDGIAEPARPLVDAGLHAAKIRAARERADALGIHLVINARADVYLTRGGDPASRFDAAVSRGRAYLAAGADCIFVPDVGDLDQQTIGRLVSALGAPINVLAGPHTPPIGVLEQLGVRRVSVGARPMRATLGLIRKMARELLDDGTYRLMTTDAVSPSEANGWFSR